MKKFENEEIVADCTRKKKITSINYKERWGIKHGSMQETKKNY